MAYNILPSTEEEARKAVGFMNETSAKEAFRLYRHLYKKYGHIIPNPLAFDSSKKNDCKIARMIQTELKTGMNYLNMTHIWEDCHQKKNSLIS